MSRGCTGQKWWRACGQLVEGLGKGALFQFFDTDTLA